MRPLLLDQLAIMLGFSAAYFANYFIFELSRSDFGWVRRIDMEYQAWRWMLGLEIVPALVWLCALWSVPETPRWLAMKGRIDEARRVLALVRPRERIERTLGQIVASGSGSAQSLRRRLGEVLSPRLRRPITIGIIVGVVQQLTGINAVYFYAPTIFEQSGVGTNAAFAQATLIGMTNIVFTILAMALIDRLGRKPLLLVGLLGVIVSTSVVGYGFQRARYELDREGVAALDPAIDRGALETLIGAPYDNDLQFKRAAETALGRQTARNYQAELVQAAIQVNPHVVLAGILGFVASFAVSLGPVMWVLFSEIFPNYVRGVALGLASVFNSVASFAVQFLFPWELAYLGNALSFYGFAALGVLGLIAIARLLPETRERSLEEIERLLAR